MKRTNPAVEVVHLRRENAELRQNVEFMKSFTIRQTLEVAMITLHRVYGFGPDRCAAFFDAAMADFVELARLVIADGKDDDSVSWSLDRFDRLVREACGETRPFAERYAPENLYSRDRIERRESHDTGRTGIAQDDPA